MPTKPSSLTDTQLVILTAAAAREDGRLLPPPPSVKARGGALTASLQSLVDKGYAIEVEARTDDTVWREDDGDRGRLTLTIAARGLAALGLDDAASPPPPAAPTSEPGEGGGKVEMASPGSKRDWLIERLSSEAGASIEELTQRLGWLPHTLRAAISGLRKRGLEVETIRDGNLTVYRCRLAEAPVAAESDDA